MTCGSQHVPPLTMQCATPSWRCGFAYQPSGPPQSPFGALNLQMGYDLLFLSHAINCGCLPAFPSSIAYFKFFQSLVGSYLLACFRIPIRLRAWATAVFRAAGVAQDPPGSPALNPSRLYAIKRLLLGDIPSCKSQIARLW